VLGNVEVVLHTTVSRDDPHCGDSMSLGESPLALGSATDEV